MYPADLKYTKDHEWVKVEGKLARIGITDHAQTELTEIVFVELPPAGKEVKAGEELAVTRGILDEVLGGQDAGATDGAALPARTAAASCSASSGVTASVECRCSPRPWAPVWLVPIPPSPVAAATCPIAIASPCKY